MLRSRAGNATRARQRRAAAGRISPGASPASDSAWPPLPPRSSFAPPLPSENRKPRPALPPPLPPPPPPRSSPLPSPSLPATAPAGGQRPRLPQVSGRCGSSEAEARRGPGRPARPHRLSASRARPERDARPSPELRRRVEGVWGVRMGGSARPGSLTALFGGRLTHLPPPPPRRAAPLPQHGARPA